MKQKKERDYGKRGEEKWRSFLMCLCFGLWGVHKFYEKKYFIGFLYLCTGGICGFGVLVDLIRIALKGKVK